MLKFAPSFRSLTHRGGIALACALGALSIAGCSDSDDDTEETTSGLQGAEDDLSFFVSSTTQDGNLGGLAGADTICQTLGAAAGAGSQTWRAYLSAENGGTPIHARTRIGAGPWYNADGVMLASDLTSLHALTGNPELFIDENGTPINGQWNGVAPNEHDIMTGSDGQGMLIVGDTQTTCADWTSNTLTPGPQVGHTDGMGPMMSTAEARFTSWGGGHATPGCASAALQMTGGAGRIYCFAAN
jgi:hypothetical protein